MRFVSAIIAVFLLVASATAALAHAALVASEPVDGAVLAAPPAELTLTFNEPVSPTVLQLVGPDGKAQALDHRAEGAMLAMSPPAGLGKGSYALSWRVISADGHPVAGSLVFSVGAPGGSPLAAAGGGDSTLASAFWLAKVVLYVGLFIGVGGAVFGAFIASLLPAAARAGQCVMMAGLVAAVVSLGLEGADALGLGLGGFFDGAAWSAGARTTYAITVALACAALLLGLVSGRVAGKMRRIVAAVALAAVGLALAASGHASTASPQMLTRPLVFIHAVAVAWWLGALLPLALAVRRGGVERDGALLRFSRYIPYWLAALVLSGPVLAWIQVERVSALWTTAYGRVLLVKLALVAALLAIAAGNRWLLTAPVARGEARAGRRMVAAIGFEIAVAVAVLGVVALWRFTPPPRALSLVEAVPAVGHIHSERAMVDLTLSPGRAGPVQASLYLQTGDFTLLAAQEVTVEFSEPAAGIAPIRRAAHPGPENSWVVDDLTLPTPGEWTVSVAILVSDFDLVRVEGTITVRP